MAKNQNTQDKEQDIFSALIAKHDIQRKLCDELNTHLAKEDIKAAKERYAVLEIELQAHAAAEERHLYVPVMAYDAGLDLSRHAIAEHHEMDELMHKLNDGRIGDDTWTKTCQELVDEVRHHLKEEENEFFKDAKKLLDKEAQQRLGVLYLGEHNAFEQRNG